MSYQTASGVWVHTVPLVAAKVASAARTTSSNGSSQETDQFNNLVNLVLDITVDDFTTLDVIVQTGPDNSTWYTAMAFTQATVVSAQRKNAPGLDRYFRIAWTLVGTSATFSVGVLGGELR